ncbi:MAG: hypothetical protein O7D91_12345 [Planctomycetota bacterium]|nr:hypothetical protein [Planctomycetota bacterium]
MNSQHASLGNCALSTLLSLVVSVFTVTGQAKAQCQYDVTVLQFPIDCGIGTVITAGLSLNENGAVVGRYKCPISKYSQGFLWTAEGGFVALEPPPGVIQVVPTGINDHGVICGTMIVDDIGFRGFVYDHGVWTVLPPVVDMLGTWSSAAAINNDGIVVGQRSITENLNPQNAYIWSADEGFTDLGVMNGPYSAATAVSDTGVVVGWTGTLVNQEAFLWEAGNVTLLGPIPGGFTSRPSAVSNNSVIVGWGHLPMDGFPFGIAQAFLRHDAKFSLLGSLTDHLLSAALSVRGEPLQVVGVSWYVDGNPNISRAFIWQNRVLTDLNALTETKPGLVITSAAAINDSGVILANASGPQGVITLLLTPFESPLGDLDADCEVGILDLLILLAAWGEAGSPADLNNDGVVGILDLLILLANWT